jgi:hypothetical protein
MPDTTTPANPAEEPAACCGPEAEADCCEPSDKADCCGPAATASGGCGCSASAQTQPPAVVASLGAACRPPVGDVHEGETVLDLGSGAGADVLISARRVGDSGKAIGFDMTDEMLAPRSME